MERIEDGSTSRREFFAKAGIATLGVIGVPRLVLASSGDEPISPNEDLMRDHGLLKRLLFAYEEYASRIDGNLDIDPAGLHDSAQIMREFFQDHHEKLEEKHLFPRFRGQKLNGLVSVLWTQHKVGRKICDTTLKLSNASSLKNSDERLQLAASMRLFKRMYERHEAWEDTVVFPAFQGLISKGEYDDLGKVFEDEERARFPEGFEVMLERVVVIEKKLGINDLEQYTPRFPDLQAEALAGSQVRLGVVENAGYSSVAIDSRRTVWPWKQIGVCETTVFIDGRAPLVPGQPEVREYRAQGRANNVRIGPLSGVVSAVTVP